MSQHLSTGNFKWLTEKQIQTLNIDNLQHDGNEGFILEVDLQYLKPLHHKHNNLACAPEQVKVS